MRAGNESISALTETVDVLVTHDVAGAQRRLRAVWPGALCVSKTTHTYAELLRVSRELTSEPGYLGGGPELQPAAANGARTFAVAVSFVYDDGTRQRRFDSRYGPGVVTVTSALRPYQR